MKRTIIAAALLATACSSSEPNPLIGTWTIATGTSTYNCGGTTNTVALSGALVFIQGTAGILATIDGCSEVFNSNSTGEGANNTMCAASPPEGAGLLTISTDQISIVSAGGSAGSSSFTDSAVGTFTLTSSGATCTYVRSISATKTP